MTPLEDVELLGDARTIHLVTWLRTASWQHAVVDDPVAQTIARLSDVIAIQLLGTLAEKYRVGGATSSSASEPVLHESNAAPPRPGTDQQQSPAPETAASTPSAADSLPYAAGHPVSSPLSALLQKEECPDAAKPTPAEIEVFLTIGSTRTRRRIAHVEVYP